MGFEIKGLKEFQKKLNNMAKAAKSLDGAKVSFDVLFNKSFMRKYTSFTSFDELLAAGGFIVNSEEDFEAIPDDVFDKHIKATTKFKTWEAMLSEASSQYAAKKLGF